MAEVLCGRAIRGDYQSQATGPTLCDSFQEDQSVLCIGFFFFQAEDGIRDLIVTGVQTCALPISSRRRHTRSDRDWSSDVCSSDRSEEHTSELQSRSDLVCRLLLEIGRASCRERV